MFADLYDCATGNYIRNTDAWFPACPCDTQDEFEGGGIPFIASHPDGAIVPGPSYACTEDCGVSSLEPEVCDGLDASDTTPTSTDEGCGDDEFGCSAGDNDRDGAPIRFSSGRVESNPITLIDLPSPDGIFFGYRIVWGSHIRRGPARAIQVNGDAQAEPEIHHSEEATHFLGNGWLDDYSDRLYINVRNKPINTPPTAGNQITWQHRMGTVTFTYSSASGWTSRGGKFELIDRAPTAPHTPPADGFGRWVVRTVDPTAPRRIWSFEEFSYVDYASFTFKMGRLRRHALLTSNLADLNGRFGFTVNWNTNGTISSAVDTLGRQLLFSYSSVPLGGVRALLGVSYKPTATAATIPLVELQMTANTRLERVRRVDTVGYTRFLYFAPSGSCLNCGSLITAVIGPGPGSTITPGASAPIQTTEIALEENWYGPSLWSSSHYVGIRSRYPGREYAYEHEINKTTQFDLHQPQPASCAGGTACGTGYSCRTADDLCYRAEVKEHHIDLKLPTVRSSGGGGGNGSPMHGTRTYNTPKGVPRSGTDASGMRTSYGFDTAARVRCIVRNDNDDEAFATPASPDTSECAVPPNRPAQIIRVDYTTTTITKTTPSLLGGNVVEVTSLDPTSLLETSVSTTGNTKDINGAIQSLTRTTATGYDTFGRVIEKNGPLADSAALDKTTTTYHTTFNATWPHDLGRVYQVTRYIGTSAASTPVTETYTEYDAFGVPHRVVGPNGQATTYTASADRLTWTIRECATGAGCTALSTTTVVFNPEGTVRSVTDPDGICTTYNYTEGSLYIGAPTRIRRATAGSSCGADIVGSLLTSGEVELRTYASGEPDRLLSIERKTDGVQEYILGGFVYDRNRRVTNTPFVNGGTNFSVVYTDVLQTGVIAPGGASAGSWRTETTVDTFGRPSAIQRFIDSTNKITHTLGYASPWSPRPTTLTRGQNGAAVSTSTFTYDDFGRLVDSTVPEAGPPGSPAPTRFEYDVGDRLVKKRIGSGTAMVRTDLRTYDSLGRVLSVDNDTEHPVNCSTAQTGTPIQDEEYKYDACSAPDVPSGFTCGNALGRLTIARAVVQCGSVTTVKRGRWFDYDEQGRVKRVAYATVTGTTVGPPAISTLSYTPSGRMTGYGSPLNTAYGTTNLFVAGKLAGASRSSGTQLAYNAVHNAFGPMKSFQTTATTNSGGTLRRLEWTGSSGTNYAPTGLSWIYKVFSGTGADVALLSQVFSRTSSGLLLARTDAASVFHSRGYTYDALPRLTRERMLGGTASWTLGQFTFGNGLASTTPADARTTANIRSGDVNLLLVGDGNGYVSQGTETTQYSSGSTQPLSVTRPLGGGLTFTHDVLGRRTSDKDTNEALISQRTYTYLPNGQLRSVHSVGSGRKYEMRYDEAGHPITISELYAGTLFNTYELFWQGDRLIATQIAFATPRPYPTATPCLSSGGCYTYGSIRWHYHYLGDMLLGATRERVHTDGTVYTNLFWFLTDERGLIHRVVDSQGGTWWQAHWDAQGTRTYIGTPEPEMWIPFALPGQILLGDYNVETYANVGIHTPGAEATIKPASVTATASSVELPPYYASSAVDKNLATRWSSAWSDPQWITVDLGSVKPISGVRLTWEYAYADGYRIDVANSSAGPWTTVMSTTTGNGGVDEILFSANARYVRMYGTHRATPYGYSLFEFEVLGPWTRPPIAINQWRSADSLLGAFLQPDDGDSDGRYQPEGYAYAFSMSVEAADVDGMRGTARGRSSLQLKGITPWKWSLGNAACRARRGEIEAAINKAWDDVMACTSGECGGFAGSGSFKRQWIWALHTGTYYCAEFFQPAIVGSKRYGVYDVDDGVHTPGTLNTGFGRSAWAATPAPLVGDKLQNRVTILGATTPCLARDVAHEAAHWVYYTLPADALYSSYGDYVFNPYGPGSLHDYYKGEVGNDDSDHAFIKELDKCVSCP